MTDYRGPKPKLYYAGLGWLCPRCFRKLVAVPAAERALAQAVSRRLKGVSKFRIPIDPKVLPGGGFGRLHLDKWVRSE